MDNPSDIEWQVTHYRCDEGEVVWCVAHLRGPKLIAAVSDRVFSRKHIPGAFPPRSTVWIEKEPGKKKARLLRIEAMRILQEAREEHRRAIDKGWAPDFIIGESFNANFFGRCLAQPLGRGTRTASSSRSRP